MAERNVLVDGVGVALGTTSNPLQISGSVYANPRWVTKNVSIVQLTTGNTGGGGTPLFQVSGTAAVKVFAIFATDVTATAATATISVGISSSVAAITVATQATSCNTGMIWVDALPSKCEPMPTQNILKNETIRQFVATKTLSGGSIDYYCIWEPIVTTSTVVAV